MYRLLATFVLLLSGFFLSGQFQSPSTTMVISDELSELNVSHIGYKYLIDPSKSITLDEAIDQIDQFTIRRDNKGFTPNNEVLWTTLSMVYLGDHSSKEVVLELAHAHLEEYHMYILESDSLIYSSHQGDMFPFHHRELEHNLFVHNITLENGLIYDIYFRFDQHGIETTFPLHIYGLQPFYNQNISDKIFHGIIIGLCLITSILTFILYFVFKQNFYLIEVGVSIFSILYILAEEGYGYMFLWPDSPIFNGQSRPLSVGGIFLFGLWFTLEFLDTKHQSKLKWRVALTTASTLSAFMLLAHPFNLLGLKNAHTIGDMVLILMILSIINGIVILWISVTAYIHEKNKDGLAVFLVFLVTILLSAIRTLGIEGLVEVNTIVKHTGFITRALHIPIIGIYLVYNALELLNQSKNVQIKLLEEKEQANKILIKEINQERQRIAMAIHDSAGSILTGLMANYDRLKGVHQEIKSSTYYQSGKSHIKRLNHELRAISNNLYPNTLQKLGIVEEIKRQLQLIESVHMINTHLEVYQESEAQFDNELALQIYYVIREILDNAVIHAKANNVWVQYNQYDNELNIIIEDDGIGFDHKEAINKNRQGLVNLNYRIKVIDGNIDIYTKPDNGTCITLNIPLKVSTS